MNDKQWDDYLRRQPHTFWGEVGREMDKANELKAPVFKPKSQKKEHLTRTEYTEVPQTQAPSKPIFQWVDRLIEMIPQSIRMVIKVTLVIFGALIATGYSQDLGVPIWVAAAAGAVAGYLVPTLLFIFVKLTLLACLVVCVLAFFYVIYLLLT